MATHSAYLPIRNEFLEEFMRRASGFLAQVEWRAKPSIEPQSQVKQGFRESSLVEEKPMRVSLLKIARVISQDEALLKDDINHCLHVLRKGLQIGMYLSKTYTESSGLERLIEQNKRGGLAETQKTEFRNKYHTASAITIFAAAYYLVWELSDYKADELSNVHLDFAGIPELSLQNPVRALQCMLYYYYRYLDSGDVRTDLDFVKISLLYFQAILDEIKLRESSFGHVDAFASNAYKLQDSDFHIEGFAVDVINSQASIEFNRVELSEIVGNQEAKHSARRLVERLLCYDPVTKQNPFVELGGFPTLRMGYGKPGTGKSLQIAATATMLHDRCQDLGIPFLFWPMPDTIVSTFQGGSAERMVNWMRPLQDSSKIIYAPIDDGENNLEDRSRQGVSAGVREVIGVFLRYTEGAYAVNHGNAAIDIFTNLPDQIDKAVLSRIVARFAIDGAETKEDFLDQDYLWWRRYLDIDPKFINMQDPSYSYLSAQLPLKSLNDRGTNTPKEEQITKLFAESKKDHKLTDHSFFADLFWRVHEHFPFFTSRDVRNIQQGINSRIMDFDLPDEWFNNHEAFFGQSYEQKKSLLIELMHSNMKGLSFADIRLQETVQYLDNMVRIASVTRERRISELVDNQRLQEEVKKRLAENNS